MDVKIENLSIDKNNTYFHKEYVQDYFTSPRHYHTEYEITYISKSNGKLYAGNNIIDFHEGDLYLFAPQLVHSFKNSADYLSEHHKCCASVILFRKDFCGNDFLYRKETFRLKELLINAEKGLKFTNPPEELINLITGLGEKKELEGIIDLLRILNLLSNHNEVTTLTRNYYNKYYYHHSKDDKIDRIIEYIYHNLSEELEFKKIAKMAGMSVPSFSRFFKQRTEKNYTVFLNELRIHHSQTLLMDTDMNISEISKKCGYKNLSHFNRQFKKLNNITPKEFRYHFLNKQIR